MAPRHYETFKVVWEEFSDWFEYNDTYYEDAFQLEPQESRSAAIAKVADLIRRKPFGWKVTARTDETLEARSPAGHVVRVEPGYMEGMMSIRARRPEQRTRVGESMDDDNKEFYLTIRDGQNVWIARIYQDERNWEEEVWEVLDGDADHRFGSKNYMSYLSPDDICSWLNRDYDEVSEPRSEPYRGDQPGSDPWAVGSDDEEEFDEDASGGSVGGGAIAGGDGTVPAPEAGIPRRRVPIKETERNAVLDKEAMKREIESCAKMHGVEDPYALRAMERLYTIAFYEGSKAQIAAGGLAPYDLP